jgi:aminoglycoside 6'-N-acetyltransferase
MDPERYRTLRFEPLKEQDIQGVFSWLQLPHVRKFYHPKPLPSWRETREKYLQRLDPDWPTKCFLICTGRPIGYIQTYRVADHPDYAETIGEFEGISVDLFIGEPQYIGNGWGRVSLLKFINEVAFPLFPREEVCWIYHDKMNHRALRASMAVGFQYVRDFIEDGTQKELLTLSKAEGAALAGRVVAR